jgi:hypothetical protein
MRRSVRTALAALPLVLPLALTGCGSDDSGGKVASAGGQSTASAGATTAAMSQDEKAVKYAQCLREQGLKVDDPAPGEGVQLKIDKGAGVNQVVIDKAMTTCRQYSPQGTAGKGTDPKSQERIRKFAECMRKNGVEEFPDPSPGQGTLVMSNKTRQDPDFAKAQQACQGLLSAGAPSGGQ